MRDARLLLPAALIALLPSLASAEPVAAAQGRVEAVSETRHLAFGVTGQIAEMLVSEGQTVAAGQVLARLRCDDRQADLDAARNALQAKQAEYVRAKRGARREERAIVAAEVQRIAALLANARSELRRYNELVANNQVPVMDTELRSTRVADLQQQLTQSLQRLDLVRSALLPEEDQRWLSEVAAASAKADAARSRVDYCTLRSPLTATVLRIHAKAGEAVSEFVPAPVVDIADLSRLRVRAEIEDRDIGKISIGSQATIRVDTGDGGLKPIAAGRVVWLSPTTGIKQIQSSDPAARRDREVREALIDLDKPTELLTIAQRVSVLFER